MTIKEIKQIIRQLESHEMSVMDVPEEVRYHKKIVTTERKLGLRKELNRGFDVIHNFFFVEEKIFFKNRRGELIDRDNRLTFNTFEGYYEYLDGDIYERACYKYCDFDKYRDFIKEKKIDITRLLEKETFLTETVDDLSLDISQEDFSLYEIDETTKLPLIAVDDLICEIHKEYQNGKFVVWKEWKTKEGISVKKDTFVTPYFFDFVYYLKGNLSDSFLIFCDGLENLKDFGSIDFSRARMTSRLCEKFGIFYENYNLNREAIESFAIAEENEENTSLVLCENENREIMTDSGEMHSLSLLGEYDRNSQRIYYITDIHLRHRLQNANCKSKEDVIYVLQKIIDIIVNETGSLLLIGGDVSSEFSVFEFFIKILKWKLDRKRYGKTEVVFVLGNHELWGFPEKSFEEIVNIYRKLIEGNGMYLLQNELLYKDSDDKICKISCNELLTMSIRELRKQIQSTRIVILGGLAFSGYNERFNANHGVYQKTIDRVEEIAETKKFEELYNKILPGICDKNTIIFTHTPKKDWDADAQPYKNFVYVNGHTHRNEFYDDGDYRIYSDNQIGYRNENPHLKTFLLDSEYDIFSDYEDGIYEITGEQYNDFYRGKNKCMNFTREVNVLYMLKKKGYYCFIHKAKSGSLTILNGGSLNRLIEKDVNYYYDHMDEVISYIRKPLDKYMSIQQRISEEIRKLGGAGTIHGCIIDIDWYNHIYVNPIDLTIAGYWALNMIEKVVYPDVPALLEAKCPVIYGNYLKFIKDNKKNSLIFAKKKKDELRLLPQKYFSTDIYRASREIKKMQKLTSNILCSWYENPNEANVLLCE